MKPFDGKLALVTGAGTGIGAAISCELAARGARVLLLGRRMERLLETKNAIEKAGGLAAIYALDIRDDARFREVLGQIHSEYGTLDIVVANAGFQVRGKLMELELEDYRRQFETNVFATLRTIQLTASDLLSRKGRLAVVGSVNGFISLPGSSAYGMSKFALRALCESIRLELQGLGVSVTHIVPGIVDSEIHHIDNEGQFSSNVSPRYEFLVRPADIVAHAMVDGIERRRREVASPAYTYLFLFLGQKFFRQLFSLFPNLRKPQTAQTAADQ